MLSDDEVIKLFLRLNTTAEAREILTNFGIEYEDEGDHVFIYVNGVKMGVRDVKPE